MSVIALIDYGMGNLLSVSKALEFVGAEVKVVQTPADAKYADGVLLPGVGNFGDGMTHLRQSGFDVFVKDWAAQNRPLLGICLGMQMMMEFSEEAPSVEGLGIFQGGVIRFPAGLEKVPHMGWNSLHLCKQTRILEGIPEDSFFYFVHSFYVKPEHQEIVAAESNYMFPFAASLASGNISAMQFHPEKSQDKGLAILRNFIAISSTQRSLSK